MDDLKQRLRNAANKRDGFDAVYLANSAADRIEELEAENARLVEWNGQACVRAETAEDRADLIDMGVLARVEAALNGITAGHGVTAASTGYGPHTRPTYYRYKCACNKCAALTDLRAMMEKLK